MSNVEFGWARDNFQQVLMLTITRVHNLMILKRFSKVKLVKFFLVVLIAGGGFRPILGQSLPTPESVLGFPVGSDFKLASYEQSLEYFQKLADASDRMELRKVGETSHGKPWYMAVISSSANLENLEHYRKISRALADPADDMTEEYARQLAQEGRAIVHIDGGLHSTEVAHAQHTIQLAYDLVTGDKDPEIAEILDKVILLLWFSINPDGQTMVSDWYKSNLGTPYETASIPFLYQKYVGHDNNRDGYMINQIESRVVTRVDRYWEPQIIYNHHQTSPFPTRIWIPPFAEPISPNVHPLMWRTVNLIGMAMAQALEERGQEGAYHYGNGFDNWYPGFMDHANNFHNVASLLTETALYRYATPHFYTIDDFPSGNRDLRPESLYPSPWKGGWWRIGDAVDYMLTASISVLDVASKYKRDILFNRFQAARDVKEQYRSAPPYAYFVPREQRDRLAVVEMLRRLAFNGITISQLDEAVSFEGIPYPKGSWVIPMDQPNANFVRQLFAVQDYPDLREYPEGPPEQPYDVSGWTLPYQFDVRVIEATTPLGAGIRGKMVELKDDPLSWEDRFDAQSWDTPPGIGFDSNPVARAVLPDEVAIAGSGSALYLNPSENNSYRAVSRAWQGGADVNFIPSSMNGEDFGSGQWLINGMSRTSQNQLVADLALQAHRNSVAGTAIKRPRIGLYRPWAANSDEGWTRWLFETYEIDHTSLYNADVKAGNLKSRYDVIVIADMTGNQIMNGFSEGSVPPRYSGGIGPDGTREIDKFVREGGTLVAINRSSVFAIDELHLPVRNVVGDVPREEYFVGGAIAEILVDKTHPVMSGMPARAKIFVGSSPVFTTEEGFEGAAIAKYASSGTPLLSGYFLGEEYVQGFAAALEAHHGEGRVVLLGMRPQWRGQPFGTFKILFNSAFYSQEVAATVQKNEKFWEIPIVKEEKN